LRFLSGAVRLASSLLIGEDRTMAKIPAETVNAWRARAAQWLADNVSPVAACTDVKTGRDAWTVAHGAGLCREAYDMPREMRIHDGHIQTALQAIFPNAVFRDAKKY